MRNPSRPMLLTVIVAAVIAATGSGTARAADVTWVGPNLSFWDLAANWNPGLPGAADNALLGAFDTEFRSGNVTILSLTGSGLLRVTGGTLQVTQASSIGSLFMSGGVFGGTGTLTVAGASTWTGGTHTGAGTTNFDGTLAISGPTTKGISGGRTVNAGSTTTWSGNTGNNNAISIVGGSVFNNAGTFIDANAFDSIISTGGGGGTFNNSGTFNKQSNTTTSIAVVFNNTGTLNVNAGTFLPGAGGTSTGVFNIADGATLEFRNGTHVLNNVTTSGLGTLQISTENVGADAFVSINGGTHTSSFLLSGSTLGGADQVFQGTATWTGGTITGAASTTFGSTLAISGANSKVISGGRTVNAGNTTWSGNTGNNNNAITLSNASIFNNTGTFTDANAFDSAMNAGGGGGTFNNLGTFNKQSNTTTSIGTVFNSTGTVNVNAGTLLMNGGGTDSGVFNIANGAKLEFRNGNHTLNNVTTSGAGTFEISTENVGADATVAVNGGTHTTAFVLSGSTLTGTDHAFQGPATWSGGTITGAATASTTFANALTISGPNGKTLSGGRSVNAGDTTWTGNTGNGNNAIGIATGSVFNSNGTFTDANAFDSAMNAGVGGGIFNSFGTFNKQSNTTTSIGVVFNSTGTVNVNAGTLLMNGGGTDSGVFNIANGAKLEFRNGNHTLNNVTTSGAGTFEISTENVGADATVAVNGGTHTTAFVLSGSTMTGSDATFQGPVTWTGGTISGAATTTFSNNVSITGPNLKTIVGGRAVNLNATTTWSGNTADNNNAIRFWNGATINNNGTFNDANAFASFIEHNVGGPHNFNNIGTYNKQSNTITTVDLGVVFNNSGTLNLNAGTMRFVSGTQGPTGTVNVASGATFQQDAASTVGNLITAGTLNLASQTITVHIDYNNANFGVGNAFNRRANVVVTGGATPRLLAAGDVNQAVSGTGVSNGATTTPTIVIGNVRVGANTFTYNIDNAGTTGPALRGAIQTNVNGGSITDSRLSGSGVTAGNWGPVVAGGSVSRDITLTIDTAGAYASLAGQAVGIVNNFENTRSQVLTITTAAGAAAYNAAVGSTTPSPVTIANQRVGGTGSQALTVANTAPAGAFTEVLNASFGANTGAATNNAGAITGGLGTGGVAGGASNTTAMSVGVNTATAGAKSGTVTLNYVSNGQGTSDLASIGVGSQTINVSGNVYQAASGLINTAPLNFGTVQVGQSVSQVLSITNNAVGPNGFVEDLNASFGATSGTGANLISGTGSISGLLAGATNNTGMTVNVDTSAAGTVNGAIAVNFVSAGAVAGASNGLGTLDVGAVNYGVQGLIQANVINTADPVINNSSIALGNVRIGAASPSAFVSLTNQAGTPPQAALNASIMGNAPITASGAFNLLAPGATDATSLQVGMNTATAGPVNGTATIALVSDASNVGGCAPNCQLNLPSQDVSVSGAVYRLANAVLNTPSVNLAARVGDAAPSAGISLTNSSPDQYTEGLKASIGATPAGFSGSGAIANLAAGATDASTLRVALATGTAGSFGGNATLALASTGEGTTGAPDLALPSQNVALSGKVYTPAVAQVAHASVDFGIVHVGDVVAAQALSVTNAAPVTALNDLLRGSLGGAAGPFSAGGTLGAGLGAGDTDSSSLSVGLNTAAAGVFNGSALASFASHNPDMADLDLGSLGIALAAQVNNYANPVFVRTSGAGSLSRVGDVFTLDLGSVLQGGSLSSTLAVLNDVLGPADLLDGSFDLSAVDDFTLAGFESFFGLAAGNLFGGLLASFEADALGAFSDTIGLTARGHNASGFEERFDLTLVLRGTVVPTSVPEPGSLALLALALAGLAMRRRTQRPVLH